MMIKAKKIILCFMLCASALSSNTIIKADDSGAPSNVSNTSEVSSRAATVQIISENDLLNFFPDPVFRATVFKAVRDGSEGAEGGSIEEALYNFRGIIHYSGYGKADSAKITNIDGIQYLRNAKEISLKYNEIKDFSFLEKLSESDKRYYGELIANDNGIELDGKNVNWDFGGNPIQKIPYTFGGRLKILQPGSTSYTYPVDPNNILVYGRNENGASGVFPNIGKASIYKNGTLLSRIMLENCSPYFGVPGDTDTGMIITKFDENSATFSNMKKAGTTHLSIGSDAILRYTTQDEYGNITPGAQSFKYYLGYTTKIYDGLTIESFTNGVVELSKTDAKSGKPLANAEYGVFRKADDKQVRTAISDENGNITIKGLWGGSYYFQEVNAPDGYYLNDEKIDFVVNGVSHNGSGFPVVEIHGGENGPITTTDNITLQVPTNNFGDAGKLFSGGKDADGNLLSPDFSFQNLSGLTPDAVEVTYAKLDVNGKTKTNVLRHFNTLDEAVADINREKAYDIGSGSTLRHSTNIMGLVSVVVFFDDKSQQPIAPMSTNDEAVPRIEISGEKIWSDYQDGFKLRPESVRVRLLRNGEKYREMIVSVKDKWQYTFTDVPEVDQYGKKITYTVEEVDIPKGYSASVKGTTITNTLLQEENNIVTVEGKKIWVDNHDAAKKRPSSIIVELYQNDLKIKETIVNVSTNWTYQFTKLPKLDKDGTEFVYTIKEGSLSSGYTSNVTGYDITNTYKGTPEQSKKSSTDTSDSTNLNYWTMLLLISVTILIFVVAKKRKKA